MSDQFKVPVATLTGVNWLAAFSNGPKDGEFDDLVN